MPDYCLITLAKSEELWNLIELIKFLKPWYNISKYVQEIFQYLEKNCLLLISEAFVPNLSKAK